MMMGKPTPADTKGEPYSYYVGVDNGWDHRVPYNGPDAAEAMAAWSKAVTDGKEYVVLEALRERPERSHWYLRRCASGQRDHTSEQSRVLTPGTKP